MYRRSLFVAGLAIGAAPILVPPAGAAAQATNRGDVELPPSTPGIDAGTDDISSAERQLVKDHFRRTFIEPDLVLWTFDTARPYPLGGTAVCGRVNYTNSGRHYYGDKPFYAVVEKGRITAGGIVSVMAEDPVGGTAHAYTIVCGGRR